MAKVPRLLRLRQWTFFAVKAMRSSACTTGVSKRVRNRRVGPVRGLAIMASNVALTSCAVTGLPSLQRARESSQNVNVFLSAEMDHFEAIFGRSSMVTGSGFIKLSYIISKRSRVELKLSR